MREVPLWLIGCAIGCPELVGRRKGANSNGGHFFCSSLYSLCKNACETGGSHHLDCTFLPRGAWSCYHDYGCRLVRTPDLGTEPRYAAVAADVWIQISIS